MLVCLMQLIAQPMGFPMAAGSCRTERLPSTPPARGAISATEDGGVWSASSYPLVRALDSWVQAC